MITQTAACINAQGKIESFVGTVSLYVKKIDIGLYEIVLPLPAKQLCAIACLADVVAGNATCVVESQNLIKVRTFDSAGQAFDSSFTLSLFIA